MIKKHVKPSMANQAGGIVEQEGPIDISNVMLLEDGKTTRVGFKMDLGCVLWGRPSVYCNDDKVLDTNQNGDGGGIMKVATKLKVYPVLNFRICGRII